MNIKKVIGISVSVIAVIVLSALTAFGILGRLKEHNIIETGNVLGVEWYEPSEKEFTISTKQELYEFVALSDFYTFEGQTIRLGADIVINEGNAKEWMKNAPAERWKPISGFNGTFDGQGHSISGVYGTVTNAPMALFTHTGKSCTIQNLKLVNSFFKTSGNSGTASIVSNGNGKFVKLYSDATIEHNGDRAAGIVGIVESVATLDECWYDGKIHLTGEEGGGLISAIASGRVTVKHCLFSGELVSDFKFSGNSRNGGICARVDKNATLVMSDTLVSGSIKVVDTACVGTVVGIVISGGEVSILDSYDGAQSEIQVPIGSGKSIGQAIKTPRNRLIGKKAYQWTTLDFDNYWAAIDKETPVLKTFAQNPLNLAGVEKQYDLSWYNKEGSNFTIANAKQLYGFYILSASNTFENTTVKLTADISLNSGNAKDWSKAAPENEWIPLFNSTYYPFAGIFDGQGHTISGVYVKDTNPLTSYTGLFAVTSPGSRIQNLKLTNSYFERTGRTGSSACFVGSIAGEARGVIDSVYSNAIVVADGQQVGGIVGRLNYMDTSFTKETAVQNTWFDGEVRGATKYFGGVVGAVGCGSAIKNPKKAVVRIANCLNTGYITNDRVSNADGFGGQYGGGILGSDVGKCTINMEGCLNAGKFDLKYQGYVGGVVGRMTQTATTYNVTSTYHVQESWTRSTGATGAVVNGIVATLPESMLTGNKGYQFTNLDFTKYWTVVENDTPILRQFASKKVNVTGVERLVDTSWYKSDAQTMTIDSLKDLYGFYQVATFDKLKGKTVKLGADIVVNPTDAKTIAAWKNGTATPSNPWSPIGTDLSAFAGTFDGQGHYISGVYMKDTSKELTYSGLFGVADTGSVIQNFELRDSYFERKGQKDYNAMVGSIVSELRGSLHNVYSNAIIVTDGKQVGGLVSRMNYMDTTYESHMEVTNCWFDGEILGGAQNVGGVIGVVRYGSAIKTPMKTTTIIKDCLNTGYITNDRTTNKDHINGGQYIGGILATEFGSNKINMSGCLNAGKIELQYQGYVGGIVGRIQNAKSEYTITNSYAVKEKFNKGYGGTNSVSTVDIKVLGENQLTGSTAYASTTLDFENAWMAVQKETPILRVFKGDKKEAPFIDDEWYKNGKSPYKISTMREFYGLEALVNSGVTFEGQVIQLVDDIDLNPGWTPTIDGNGTLQNKPARAWAPMGNFTNTSFKGTLTGLEGSTIHSISGIYVDTTSRYAGLFGYVSPSGVIENLVIKNSYIGNSELRTGSLVGQLDGTVSNVSVESTVVVKGAGQTGGLVGMFGEGGTKAISNCWFAGKVFNTKNQSVGGIVGYVYRGDKKLEDCLFTGSVQSSTTGDTRLGGLVGSVAPKNTEACVVRLEQCVSTGTLSSPSTISVSPTIGYVASGVSVSIKDTYVTDNRNIANLTEVKGKAVVLSANELKGSALHLNTALDLKTGSNTKGVWVATADGPELAKFTKKTAVTQATGQKIDRQWYYNNWIIEETRTYSIANAAELLGFADVVNKNADNFASDKVQLTADINLNSGWTPTVDASGELTGAAKNYSVKWTPIGTSSTSFAGTFDGQKHTISGVCVQENLQGTGLFAKTSTTAQIKNFILDNSYVKNTSAQTGAIVGAFYGTLIENIKITDKVVVKGKDIVGGFAGMFSESKARTISGCWFAGNIYAGGQTIGGIMGRSWKGTNTIENCLVTGSINSTFVAADTGVSVGGFIGAFDGYDAVTIKDSVSIAILNVAELGSVGGAIGNVWHEYTPTIEDAYVGNTVTCSGSDATAKSTAYSVDGTSFNKDDFATKDAAEVVSGIFKKSDNTDNTAWTKVTGSYPVPAWTK